MKLQDYIHYYIGCKIQHEFITKTKNIELRYGILMGLHTSEIINRGFIQFESYSDSVRLDSIKPILRRIGDRTDEEMDEVEQLKGEKEAHGICVKYDTPEVFHWAIKKMFDLFGLIDAGLAVDSKTLK